MQNKLTHSSDKLKLIKGSDGKAQIRYTKSDDPSWKTIYLEETDLDKLVDQLTKKFLKK